MSGAGNHGDRLLLVCGSLRPGRDGVGDYSRNLARELNARGWETRIAAIAEREAHEAAEIQDGQEVLRMREDTVLGQRLERVSRWLCDWRPAVVSVQLSPFGLVPRGLLGGLGRSLRRQWPDAAGQVMFHELWCGMDGAKAPFRERLLGWLQRRGIKRFLREFRPVVAHTSNAFYRGQLEGLGCPARVLPLAGAIPVAKPQSAAAFDARLREAGLGAVAENRGEWWLGAVFGSVYSMEVLSDLTAAAARIGASQGRRVALVFFGHSKVAEASLRKAVSGAGGEPAVAGALPEEAVSQWMLRSDFGVCTTPMDGVGKSSSMAAFLDHGVPVLLHPSRLECCEGTPPPILDPLILTADAGLAERLRDGWPRGAAEARAGRVAGQFLEDLRPLLVKRDD